MKTLTTSQLIKALKDVDPNGKRKVLLSSDEEGNAYGNIDTKFSFSIDPNAKDVLFIFPVSQTLADEMF